MKRTVSESGRGLPHSKTLSREPKVLDCGSPLPLSITRRVIEPELLDVLSPADARAQHSRRDLIRLNWIMRHGSLMTRMMENTDFDTLIDLGTGDGRFAQQVVRRLRRPCRLVLVDQQRVPGAPTDVVVSDVMDFLKGLKAQPRTAVMANLFLHHFSNEFLRELFLEISRKADWFFACEPRRSRLSMALIRLLPFLGCNAVTRHDAAASIRAGLRDQELTGLWPQSEWKITERECGFASHCFMASR
jgi:hypothetical protein